MKTLLSKFIKSTGNFHIKNYVFLSAQLFNSNRADI